MNIKLDRKGLFEAVMKTAMKVLKENMETEGGNAISQAEPIRGDLAGQVAQQLIDMVSKGLKCQCKALGSTGKKRADQTSGDIDIAISLPWEKKELLMNFIHSNIGNVEEFFSPGFKIYSIGYPYIDGDTKKVVQVDFMFTRDVEYSSFVHWSPDYTKNESMYKGAFRMILLKLIVGQMPLDPEKFKEEKYGPEDYDGSYDGVTKSWWKYSLDTDNGLQIVHRTNAGKKKALKNSVRIPQDTITVSDNINDIIKIALGPSATVQDCNSWESLVDFLFSGRYKYGTPENIQNIFKYFFQSKNVVEKPEMAREMYGIIQKRMNDAGIPFGEEEAPQE